MLRTAVKVAALASALAALVCLPTPAAATASLIAARPQITHNSFSYEGNPGLVYSQPVSQLMYAERQQGTARAKKHGDVSAASVRPDRGLARSG